LLVCRDDPVVRLNRAVAVMERGDPRACLFELTPLADALSAYPYFHVARAEALVRLGRRDEAVAALRGAIDLTDNAPLRAELMRRVARL
jgi:RNA polymerase sigma-70 factor (ECF subfamily)